MAKNEKTQEKAPEAAPAVDAVVAVVPAEPEVIVEEYIPKEVIRADLAAIRRPAPPPSRRYWVGVHPDAPFDSDSRGGIAFQKWDGYPVFDERGRPTNDPDLGTIATLTESQVELIRARVSNVVLRLRDVPPDRVVAHSVTVEQRIFLASVPGYVPGPRDVPLGFYLYCVPLESRLPAGWREVVPESARMVPFARVLDIPAAPAAIPQAAPAVA